MVKWNRMTFFLLNLICVLDRADEIAIPAIIFEIGQNVNSSSSSVGLLLLLRSLSQAVSSPVAAYLSINHRKASLIGYSSIFCGLASVSCGLAHKYWSVSVWLTVSGLCSGLILPAILSSVAEIEKEHERGSTFGWIFASGQLGIIIGTCLSHALSSQVLFSIPSWRLSNFFISFWLIICGIGVLSLSSYPKKPKENSDVTESNRSLNMNQLPRLSQNLETVFLHFYQVLSVSSFNIITIEGAVGQITWLAVYLFPMWLQMSGYSSSMALLLTTFLFCGSMFGSVFGGVVGDVASQRNPTVGRILCAQFSVGLTIPISAVLLEGFSRPADFEIVFGLTFFLMGFLASWVIPACSWPVLSEVVPPRLRTAVFSLNQFVLKSLLALSTPVILRISRNLNESVNDAGAGSASVELVSKQLFISIAMSAMASVMLTFGLYWTYSRDRDRARVESWVYQSAISAVPTSDNEPQDCIGVEISPYEEDVRWSSDEERSLYEDKESSESPPVSLRELELRAELENSTGFGHDESSLLLNKVKPR